jgi:hypothetical protein
MGHQLVMYEPSRRGKRRKRNLQKKYGQLNMYGIAISLPQNSEAYKI